MAGCYDDPGRLVTAVCSEIAAPDCSGEVPRYADVEPIFRAKCVPCHLSETDGPWPLKTYEDIADWADLIRKDVLDCSMPPTDGDVSMSHVQRLILATWVLCGYPQ